MQQYLNLLEEVLATGTLQANRTGIKAKSIPGAMLKFDMDHGFPAVTTKKLSFNQVKGELIGFMRGYTNAADFRNLGCNIWDGNANDPGLPGHPNMWLSNPNRKGEDDLGRIYGAQWRDWSGNVIGMQNVNPTGRDPDSLYFVGQPVYEGIDQLKNAINKILNTPTDRRIIVSAWNPAQLDQMALPPCHLLYQFLCNVETNELSMCMYQRSCDMFLGVPFNIASYALLLHTVAALTGFKPRHLTMFLADVHIYENHFDQVAEQLARIPHSLPTLEIAEALYQGIQFEEIEPHHFNLVNYTHDAAIKAPMAV